MTPNARPVSAILPRAAVAALVCVSIGLSALPGLWAFPPPAYAAPGSAILVESFATRPEVAVAGETFDLTVVLDNHTTRRADDVQVTVGASSAPSAASGSAPSATGPDLAVVGTGNTLRVGRVAAESHATVTFTLAADPAARAGVHTVPLTITYEVAGRPEELTQSLGVLVTRIASLDLTTFELPDEAVAGEPFDVLAEVMNTGDGPASGVTLTLTAEGPGDVTMERGELVAGTLESGDLDIVEGTITPAGAGTVEITLTIAHTDALGTVHEETHTRSVTVVEPDTAAEPDDDSGKSRGFFGSIAAFFRALFGLGE